MNFSKISQIVFLILKLLCSLSLLTESRRVIREPRASLFNDEYGHEISYADCPTDKNANPKISTSNLTRVYYFSLTCLAPYPITVEFEGSKVNMVNSKLYLAQANPTNSTKACFIVNLSGFLHRSWYSPIGTYTCKSLSDSKKASSIYIFAKESWYSYRGDGTPFNMESTEVFVNTNNISKLFIPCPASKEGLNTAVLRKDDKGTGFPVDVDKKDPWKVTYDPTKGFTVEFPFGRNENSSDVDGKYRCRDTATNRYVEVDVKHADYIAFPNNTNLTFDTGNPLIFECYGGEPVFLKLLNTTGNLKQQLEETNNTNPLHIPDQYKNAGYVYGAKMTLSSTDPKVKGDVVCETAAGKQLAIWKFDNEYRCVCQWNSTQTSSYGYGYDDNQNQEEFGESSDKNKRHSYMNSDWQFYNAPYGYGEFSCWNEKASVVDWDFIPCSNEIECQILRHCLLETACPLLENYRYYGSSMPKLFTNITSRMIDLRPGILQCKADGFITMSKLTTSLDLDLNLNGDKPVNLVRIRASEDRLYTGDTMLFSCLATNYFLFSQMIWAFENKDGSLTYPEINNSPYSRYGYRNNDQTITGTAGSVRTSLLIIPSKDSKRLWCFVPQWNSTEWAKASVDLKIEDAVPAENPPKCPKQSTPFIVMYRNASTSTQRVRLPHIVDATNVFIYEPVLEVALYCLAKFPIVWLKDGQNISAARTSRANCKNDKGQVNLRLLYKSTIIFSVSALNATGNYTCKSTTPRQSRQTSVYIYATSNENRTTFVNEGHHYIVHHKYDNNSASFNKWAILPCRLNTPNVIPYLFIDHAEEDEMERVSRDNSFLKFDPKVGFSIDVTNRIVKDATTVFVCSDHKDGSFIGNMVTLELIYDRNSSIVQTTPPNNITLGIPTTTHKTTKRTSTVAASVTMQPQYNDNGSSGSGFVISIVLLTALCFACFAVIYHLYQKITLQQKVNPPPQELDWTHATVHTGNNIGSLIETQNNLANNIDSSNMPSLTENDFNYKQLI